MANKIQLNQHTLGKSVASRRSIVTQAIFTKPKPKVVEVETKPEPKRFSLFGGSKKSTTDAAPQTKKKLDKAAEYRKKESAVSAFDFAKARSRRDAELLYDARYGELKDGKMSKEQYQALRRKIGGTAKDYWKTWIDVQGTYTDKGYVSKDKAATASDVPALPFLIITVLALFGTLGYVVAATSN